MKVWKMSPKRGQRMQRPSPAWVLGRPRDRYGRTGAGQAFTAFISSLPVFQPQTTGASLRKCEFAVCSRELGLFPHSWPSPKDKEEKLPLPPQVLPEGPASAGRIRSGNFWSQAYSLDHCCRESEASKGGFGARDSSVQFWNLGRSR